MQPFVGMAVDFAGRLAGGRLPTAGLTLSAESAEREREAQMGVGAEIFPDERPGRKQKMMRPSPWLVRPGMRAYVLSRVGCWTL